MKCPMCEGEGFLPLEGVVCEDCQGHGETRLPFMPLGTAKVREEVGDGS